MRYVFLTLALAGFASMAPAQQLSNDQIKQLALEAILENPEIIMQAVAILEQRERTRRAEEAAALVAQMETSNTAPVMGNPQGDVTIVEFFDYNCGYCKRAGPGLRAVMDNDDGVKVVMREWPILSEASIYAARAALAARKQGRYEDMHWGLMNGRASASEASVLKLARDLGLDVDQLQSDMNSPEVEAHLAESRAMAQALGFTGTPAFIVGGQINPGYLDADQIESLVLSAREG